MLEAAPWIPILMPLLPLVAAALTAVVCVAGRRHGRAAAAPALVASVVNVGLAAALLIGFERTTQASIPWITIGTFQINIGYLVDPLATVMLAVVAVVALLVQVFSVGYMRGDDGFARYFTYLGIFVAAMLGLVLADNLLLLYMCWELVGLASYLLIGFWYKNRGPNNAAKKAFIVTRFGDMGLLLGIILLSSAAETFDIPAIATLVETGALGSVFLSGAVFITVVPLLIFFGAAGKSAQFPLHVWLPDAMEGPTPVSALIHAATMVAAGVYLIARLFFLFAASPLALSVVAWIGAITALMAATIAVVQVDIKKVLAYSTISQLGYMMLGLGLGGVTVGIFHLATHAVFKALLFLAAGAVIHGLHQVQDLRLMGGLHGRMRVTSWTALIGALALAGVFPFAGFWSKDEILLAAQSQPALFGIALFVAGLTSFYMTRLWFLAFAGAPRSEEARNAHAAPGTMAGPLVVLAALAVLAGAANLPGTHWLFTFLEPGGVPKHFSVVVAGLGTAAAILGIGIGVALYRRSPATDPVTRLPQPIYTALERKWYIDAFYELGLARASIAWAGMIAWVDRNVVDHAMHVFAWVCQVLGAQFRRLTNGQPQFYVVIFTTGAILVSLLLVWLGGAL